MGSDRLREFIELLVERADRGGEEVAARAYLSRFHFDRLVGAALRETPGAFRRRLLLERAAWQLRNASVTDAAHDAGYSSLEAFSRAFGRAYGEAPSRYRGDWDTAFVDATCDPPESFSYGGAVAHVLTWNAHRRQILAGTLRERGLVVEDADPIRWEPREA